MKKNSSMIIKSIVTLTIVASTLSSTVFAAWGWETPGYEWAREKRLTSITNSSTLSNKVSHANFYSTLIKYLQLKDVTPKQEVMQNRGEHGTFNKSIEGMVEAVDDYIWREALTAQEYREVINYINHLNTEINGINEGTVPNNANYLTRDSLKDLYLYLSLARYKAATLITEQAYRHLVINNISPNKLYNVGNVKYKEIIDYNIKPYYGEISRKEFLILMFSLLSEQNVTEDDIIQQFSDSGVLIGYEDGSLELDKPLTYAEMFTFLRRFEIFDFNPEPEVEEGEENDSDDEIKEYN